MPSGTVEVGGVKGARAEQPIVVVSGLPRSGTSLVMSMLEAGGVSTWSDGQRPPDESNPRGYYELEAVKASARDAAWTDAAEGRAVKVIHALLPHLPTRHRYAVLLVERDLSEVVASQRAMLVRSGESAGAPDDDALLVRVFARQLELTRRWLDASTHVRWQSVQHRRLLVDPVGASAEIERFLGRPLDRAAMASRVDPALHRSRA